VRLASGRYAACFDAPLPPDCGVGDRWRAAVLRHLMRHPGQWCAFEPSPMGLA